MIKQILQQVNQIVERESKTSSYKFALLRATIELIQEQSPHIRKVGSRFEISLGLIVLKWLDYYYTILKAGLPQISSSQKLAFQSEFENLIDQYDEVGGYDRFRLDLFNGELPPNAEDRVYYLCKSIRDTIKKQPMRYLGQSINNSHYSIYQKLEDEIRLRKPDNFDVLFLIDRYGKCSIPAEFYEVFRYLGSYITGTQSILINWAEFTVERSERDFSIEEVLPYLLQSSTESRQVGYASKLFSKMLASKGYLHCIWSNKKIRNDLEIDHMLPFSVWRNNDLWNLLPTKRSINNSKRDRIPSPNLLRNRKDRIFEYWGLYQQIATTRFEREVSTNLVSTNDFRLNWSEKAFESLIAKSKYLISERGFEPYDPIIK